MASKWFGLEKSAGVGFEKPKEQEVINFSSPSLNWIFGKYGGIPYGYTAILWGPPKTGKSVIIWDGIAQLQKKDLDAKVILFDTEYRAALQSGGATSKNVDMDRVLLKQTNAPEEIFDFIEKDVPAAVDAGLKLPLIVIDSISLIRGLKSMNADTIAQHLIGDQAQTLQNGFQRILPILRRKKIALLCTAQARAEMDPAAIRAHKTLKMSASYGVKHLAEWFVQVSTVNAKAENMYNEELKDANDNPLLTGNKIRVTCTESSAGGRGRTAEVTLSYQDGFIALGKEVATLAKNLGIIQKPEGGRSLLYKDEKYNGFDALCTALEQNDILREAVVLDIMEKTKGDE